MRIRILLAFLCLLLPVNVDAVMFIGAGGGAADHCSACTVADADLLCADFEGCADNCDMTEVDDGDGSVTYEAPPAGISGCTDEGSCAAKIYHTESSVDQYTEKALASAESNIYFQGWLYIDDTTIDADGEQFMVAYGAQDSGANRAWGLHVVRASNDDLVLRVSAYNDSAAYSTADGTTALSTDTWYRIQIEYIADTSVKVWLNGGGSTEAEITTALSSRQAQYIGLGTYLASQQGFTIFWDNVKVDNDTMPGNCS